MSIAVFSDHAGTLVTPAHEGVSPAETVMAKLRRHYPLDDTDARVLGDLLGESVWIGQGRSLLSEGQASDRVLAVIDGWACRSKDFRDGRRQILAFLLPGDLAGIDQGEPRKTDYSVHAVTKVRVAWISRPRLQEAFSLRPGLGAAMRGASAVEEAILRAWLVNLGQRSAYERCAFFFCEMMERLAGEDGPPRSVRLPLTQQMLAHALGLTAVHINRVVQRLRSDRLVDFRDGVLTMLDPARTRAFAGFSNAYLTASRP